MLLWAFVPKVAALLFLVQSPALPEIRQPGDWVQRPYSTDLRQLLRKTEAELQSLEHDRNAEAFIRDYLVNRAQRLRELIDEIENPQPKLQFRMPMAAPRPRQLPRKVWD